MAKIRRWLLLLPLVVAFLAVCLLIGRYPLPDLSHFGWRLYPALLAYSMLQTAIVLLAWSRVCAFWPPAEQWRRAQERRLESGSWQKLGERSAFALVLAVDLLGAAPATVVAVALYPGMRRSLVIVTIANLLSSAAYVAIILYGAPFVTHLLGL